MYDDEDCDGDDQLYISPLDKVDEVLHFHEKLHKLQEAGGTEIFNFLLQ